MFWKSKPKVSAEDKAVLDLKLQRDKIKQYQKRISSVVAREHELAKQCLANGDKQRALVLLRRKKYQQQLLLKTDQQLSTLEELTSNIEFSLIQKDVLFGLEQGNNVLKELNKQMSLERVEKIMDDSADGIAYQQEVSDMLASRITSEEELEVEDELLAMEQEARGETEASPAKSKAHGATNKSSKVPEMPKVPTSALQEQSPDPEPEQAEQQPLAA